MEEEQGQLFISADCNETQKQYKNLIVREIYYGLTNLTVQTNYKVTSWLSRNLYASFDRYIISIHDTSWSCQSNY